MLLYGWMIRRTIDREIECHFHSAFAHLFLEPIKILQRPERRLHRLVSSSLAADRPRHAGIARLACDCVVPSFAMGMTNRMNRRKIDDVEPHRFHVVDTRKTIAENRSPITVAFCRARKKFIPRAEQGSPAIYHNPGNRVILSGIG